MNRRLCLQVLASLPLASLAEGQGNRPRLRIGQIGTKHAHASGKMQTIRGLSDLFDVVGVVESDEARWTEVKNRPAYRGLKRLNEHELLADESVAAVVVETALEDLVPTALRCVQAGKHLHLDKPGGVSLPAYKELRDEASARNRVIQMGYMFRYNPGYLFIRRAVQAGWLGEITEINGMIGKMASPALRRELATLEGGGMFELACHLVDATVGILGKPEKVIAYQTPSRFSPKANDNQVAVMTYERAVAILRCNHVDPAGFSRRRFNVVGTKGYIEWQPLEPAGLTLFLADDVDGFAKGKQSIDLPPVSGRYVGEFEDLAKVIRGEQAFGWNTQHDLDTHEVVLKASGMSID